MAFSGLNRCRAKKQFSIEDTESKNVSIMKPKAKDVADELRPEYNFDYSKAVRGKYYRRLLKEGSNLVVLEPDVAKAFPNSDAVNDALRSVLKERLSRTSRSSKS